MNLSSSLQKVAKGIVAASSILTMVSIIPVSAAFDVTGANNTTGPQSYNENYWEINRYTDVELKNIFHADNDLSYLLNTGKNDTYKNTEVGNVATGNVRASLTLNNGTANTAGTTSTTNSVASAFSDPVFSNAITGPESTNVNKAYLNTERNLTVKNISDIYNDVDLKANTGKNDIIKNTVVGNVQTGNVNVSATISNASNSDQCVSCADALSLFNSTAMPDLSSNFSNRITGPDSVNVNKVEVNDSANLSVLNVSKVDNNVDVYANTGKNDVIKNTVVGDVKTGDVSVDLSINNR
jgi:hypothetical protein